MMLTRRNFDACHVVIPAKAGTHGWLQRNSFFGCVPAGPFVEHLKRSGMSWVPASAGMTSEAGSWHQIFSATA